MRACRDFFFGFAGASGSGSASSSCLRGARTGGASSGLGPGTMCGLVLELGARTPWYRIRWNRVAGSSRRGAQ
jgi:hypothetical protein